MLSYDFDKSFLDKGVKYLCGTDEAGRGPLAGPVAAAACILKPGVIIPGLDDSKKLSEKKREALFDVIKENCVSWCVALASPTEIDEINILNASLLAMRRAVDGLSVKPDYLLVDGNKCRGFDIPAESVVKGDGISQSIAAASVLAKVTRDRICMSLDKIYPQYGFAAHKGYPTREHKLKVFEYGFCPEHRMSFLSFLQRDNEKLSELLKEDKEKRDGR